MFVQEKRKSRVMRLLKSIKVDEALIKGISNRSDKKTDNV